jgi:hypothetical protein
MDCVTPSHRTPIPHGESLDIYQLLADSNSKLGSVTDNQSPANHANWRYEPRPTVLGNSRQDLDFLEAQITRVERKPSRKPRASKPKPSAIRLGIEDFTSFEVLENVKIASGASRAQRTAGTTPLRRI